MQLDELTPVLPERDWDELISTSIRRGRSLRRRRRALVASPLTAVAALLVVMPLSMLGRGHDGMARLHTTNVPPTHSSSPGPSPAATDEPQPAPPGPHLSRRFPTGTQAGQLSGRQVHPGPVTASDVPSAAHRAGATAHSVTLAYSDPQGDATPQSAPGAPNAPAAPSASDPTLDITHMSFTADRNALRISMNLLGDYRTDGYYLAYFTVARTSCHYTVQLGGSYHDYVWWTCASTSGGYFLQSSTDAARALTAVVPFGSLPGGVRTHEQLTSLQGETRLVHPADGQWPYDEAPTSAQLRLP